MVNSDKAANVPSLWQNCPENTFSGMLKLGKTYL